MEFNKFYIEFETESVTWKTLVLFLKLHKGKDVMCKIPVEGDHKLLEHWHVNLSHKEINNGYAWIYARWFENGMIYFTFLLEEGYYGDEDGFGVEPDSFLTAIADENGNFIHPFMDCESREAQWKAFECGIMPIYYKEDILDEYKNQNNKGN